MILDYLRKRCERLGDCFLMVKLIEISINRQELRNWKRNCVENKDVSHENMRT